MNYAKLADHLFWLSGRMVWCLVTGTAILLFQLLRTEDYASLHESAGTAMVFVGTSWSLIIAAHVGARWAAAKAKKTEN